MPRLTVTILGLLFVSLLAQAQQSNSSSTVSSPFQTVVVTSIPLDEAVLPNAHPATSVFGLDQSVLDIPRNMTVISRAQLDDIDIQGSRDFAKLTPSSYAVNDYGSTSSPTIRGQFADVFYNGMREGFSASGFGMPIDFNAIESVDILKGPPTVVYGVSQYVGGYVNFTTKQPYLDTFHGSINTTIGTYDQYRWNVDIGGPLIPDKLAFRVSYSGEDSGSYYENQTTHRQAFYGALTWAPTPNYTFAFNGDVQVAEWSDNQGFNRPTQNLIDNGQYFTGYIAGWNGIGRDYNQTVQEAYNLIVPTGTANLSRSIRLLAPGDGLYAEKFRGQAIQTLVLNDYATIVNNTMVEYEYLHESDSYYYSEIDSPLVSIENRTELRLNFDLPKREGINNTFDGQNGQSATSGRAKPFTIGNQINLGFDLRYQEVTSFSDDFAFVPNAWDLSLSRSYIRFINFVPTDIPVPGYPGSYATPGELSGVSTRSRVLDLGPFYEQIFNLGDHFSLLAGARADLLFIDTIDPLYDATVARGLGYLLAKTNRGYAVAVDPNCNISSTFKPWKWLTTYFTYNYSQSIAQAEGGGFPATIPIPASSYLHRPSQLFEFGAKATLLDGTLFVSSAIFQQNRFLASFFGGAAENDVVHGFEIEGDYQPNRNFYVTAGYSFLDSYVHGSPFVLQPYPIDAPQQRVPGGYVLTENEVTLPNGSYRQPGLPRHLFNFLAKYQIPTNYGTVGVILGTTVTGPLFLGYNGYVVVPWQYNMDLTFFYRTKDDHFEARLALRNLTNQKNWSPSLPAFGYDSVIAEWPFHLEATVTIRF